MVFISIKETPLSSPSPGSGKHLDHTDLEKKNTQQKTNEKSLTSKPPIPLLLIAACRGEWVSLPRNVGDLRFGSTHA